MRGTNDEAASSRGAAPPMLEDCAAVFLPAHPPREGRVAFWNPLDVTPPALPEGRGEPLTVVRRHGATFRAVTVRARVLPLTDALPVLVRARRLRDAGPVACWGAAALHALHLVARGRLRPDLADDATAIWRVGPLDTEDHAHLRAVAAAMPHEAHAQALPTGPRRDGSGNGRELCVPEPEALVRAFLDAVADALPRTAAAPYAAGGAFGGRERTRLPHARAWAAEVAAAADPGVVVSLRLDLSASALFAERDGGLPAAAAPGPATGPLPTAAAVVSVHSRTDSALVVDAAELWEGGSASASRYGPRARVDTLLALRRAARRWPPLARLLDRPVPDVLPLSDDEVYDLLGRAVEPLAAAGVAVHWPRSLARELTATAVVRGPDRAAPGSASDGFGFFDAGRLMEFRWQLALGGEPLTDAEMDALAEEHRPVVRLRDEWVLVDPALARKARKRHLGLLDPGEALAAVLAGSAEFEGEQVDVAPTGALVALHEQLTAAPPPEPAPAGLRAELRGYQLTGLAWLHRMTSLGLGGCLADDMGLGKTVTLIALHLRRAHPDPTLVVCPASLLGNWQREIERFAPGVPVRRFHGTGRSLDDAGGIVLTTYGTLRSSVQELAAHRWGMVVADEAQHAKNPHSATAGALRRLRAPARVALTGTPVENNLSELWALLDWTTPGLLGPLKSFRARFARAVETGDDPAATERLARLVRPFLLRRRKSDPGVAPELPAKTEQDHPAPLKREQASLYEAVVREALARIEESEGMARRGLVMKLLTSLKHVCNHPAQYLKEAAPGGAHRSGKLELLDELLTTILSQGGATLVFTQYVRMGRLLEEHLGRRGTATRFLHGGTPLAEREEMVADFQAGRVPVFLLSLKAAGTGLNLTRAEHVVHYDRWWNPAVEEQATDRAYRIGQTRPVQVHRLLSEGTVEERIDELLAAKRGLAEAVLGGGEAALTELTDAELADLVSLRRSL